MLTQSLPTLCNPRTIAHQAPPSMGFPRQECWSRLPFPSLSNQAVLPNFNYLPFTREGIWSSLREKAMAPHSSTLAWKIPWTEEPSRLQSMRSLRVRHDWATSLSLFTFMHWRSKWQTTSVFLPGESQGQRSLVGCLLWDHTVSEKTEATQQQQQGGNLKLEFYRLILFKWLMDKYVCNIQEKWMSR